MSDDNQKGEKFDEGKPNSHNALDPKDERSIANRLAAEEQRTEPGEKLEVIAGKIDPTLPAKMHGNEPSKGAKIDAEIQAEEEEYLRRKGKA